MCKVKNNKEPKDEKSMFMNNFVWEPFGNRNGFQQRDILFEEFVNQHNNSAHLGAVHILRNARGGEGGSGPVLSSVTWWGRGG